MELKRNIFLNVQYFAFLIAVVYVNTQNNMIHKRNIKLLKKLQMHNTA